MSNEELRNNVTDELFWDPKIDGSSIAVGTDEGAVTLRGTVGSFREKRDAQKAAARVDGVKAVDNELEVRLLSEHGRGDADLRGDVLRALQLDSSVPDTVDARVDDGWVTLTGTASSQYQREEADYVAGNIAGILGLDDQIELRDVEPSRGDVEEDIRNAFKRSAKLDADNVAVETYPGRIVLTGYVSSWAEHDEALAAAWAAPGVSNVDDHIEVIP
jgi:osmotically-inducible protein OsmY